MFCGFPFQKATNDKKQFLRLPASENSIQKVLKAETQGINAMQVADALRETTYTRKHADESITYQAHINLFQNVRVMKEYFWNTCEVEDMNLLFKEPPTQNHSSDESYEKTNRTTYEELTKMTENMYRVRKEQASQEYQ
ncbi:hypothetical protein STEG23_003086, partial [Scotinomys teguina]